MLSIGPEPVCGRLRTDSDINCGGNVYCNHVFASGDHVTSGDTSTNVLHCTEVDCSGEVAATSASFSDEVNCMGDINVGGDVSCNHLTGTTLRSDFSQSTDATVGTLSISNAAVSNFLNLNGLYFTASLNGGLQIAKNYDVALTGFRYDGINQHGNGIFEVQWPTSEDLTQFSIGDRVYIRNADEYENIDPQFINTAVFTIGIESLIARTAYLTFDASEYDPFAAEPGGTPLSSTALPLKNVTSWIMRKSHLRTLDMSSTDAEESFSFQTIPP
mgnify:CR=1 FL=1